VLFDEAVIDHLATTGYDSKMGARPLSRRIDTVIRVPMSKRILFDQLENCKITVTMTDSKVDFSVEPTATQPEGNKIVGLLH
jgi:ATP-dependent Clp protease ATP-binding subunit ClpA